MYTFFLKIKACLPSLASMLKTLNDKNLFCFKKKESECRSTLFLSCKETHFLSNIQDSFLEILPMLLRLSGMVSPKGATPCRRVVFYLHFVCRGNGLGDKKRKPSSC